MLKGNGFFFPLLIENDFKNGIMIHTKVTRCCNKNKDSTFSHYNISKSAHKINPSALTADDAGLTLPAGFSAVKVADNLGEARHIAVTKGGDIYVKLDRKKDGKGILFLQKSNDGKLEQKSAFGDYSGTAMRIKNGYLYASSNTDVY